MPLSHITHVVDQIPYREGVRHVFQVLKGKGVKTVILSAGLSLLADKAAKDLEADFVLSNQLQANDGSLTGRIKVEVAVNEKKHLVERIAAQFRVSLSEVALVGDRAFDLSHPECLRIALKPKDEVARRDADFVVEDDDLSRILQYLD